MTLTEKLQAYLNHVDGVPLYADYDRIEMARTFVCGAFASESLITSSQESAAVLFEEVRSLVKGPTRTPSLDEKYQKFHEVRDEITGTPLVMPHHDKEAFMAGAMGFIACLHEAGRDAGMDALLEEMESFLEAAKNCQN